MGQAIATLMNIDDRNEGLLELGQTDSGYMSIDLQSISN